MGNQLAVDVLAEGGEKARARLSIFISYQLAVFISYQGRLSQMYINKIQLHHKSTVECRTCMTIVQVFRQYLKIRSIKSLRKGRSGSYIGEA